jgi:6-phosphogluconolactonase
MQNKTINLFANTNDLFQFAAKDFSQRAIAAVKDKGIFSVVLAGGNTPALFFDTLTSREDYKKNIPWPQIQFFFGDERYVPYDNAESNYHMAYVHLFMKVPINPTNIYRIATENHDPQQAAQNYAQTLRTALHIKDHVLPSFDLVYLGLGENAHTASLMPCSDIVQQYAENLTPANNNTQLTAALFVPEYNMYRITLTPAAINNAQDIIFLVTGANKAHAVWEVLAGAADPLHYPAQLIHSITGKTHWYLDQTAASQLHIS